MQSGNGLEAFKATTTAVDQRIHVVMLGYILAVLSSYCPWYQYIDYDTNFGLRVSFVLLGDWGWAFALGDAWTGVLFICRQVLFLGGLLGGLVTTILSQVFEHRRGSLYLAVALLSIIILPAIAIPSLLVFLHGFPPHEFFGSIPEMHPIGEGFVCGFFASLASVALILTATTVMLDYALTKNGTIRK